MEGDLPEEGWLRVGHSSLFMQRDRFFIIDGHSMLYRAVLSPGAPLTSPSGEPTRGTYVFCKMLASLVSTYGPAYLAMAVDAPRETTWRRSIYPAYKANRDKEPVPEEVFIQVRRIKSIVRELGIAVVEVEHQEADDVIASLVSMCASPDVGCVVCSRDKDLHQLISDDCVMLDPKDNSLVRASDVEERWGVSPAQVVEVQTLAGDPTDNVPGVPGIGTKTAAKLVKRFGSVRGIVENIELLSPKMQLAFKEADLDLCRKLVELRRDLKLDVSVRELEIDRVHFERARKTFRELGFKEWS